MTKFFPFSSCAPFYAILLLASSLSVSSLSFAAEYDEYSDGYGYDGGYADDADAEQAVEAAIMFGSLDNALMEIYRALVSSNNPNNCQNAMICKATDIGYIKEYRDSLDPQDATQYEISRILTDILNEVEGGDATPGAALAALFGNMTMQAQQQLQMEADAAAQMGAAIQVQNAQMMQQQLAAAQARNAQMSVASMGMSASRPVGATGLQQGQVPGMRPVTPGTLPGRPGTAKTPGKTAEQPSFLEKILGKVVDTTMAKVG